MMPTVLALITARGGSRGIPHKNIALLAGRPLIAYTIDAAREAGCDRIVVSTDSHEIARVAHDLGAETPFIRPIELAGHDTPSIDTVLHAVSWLDENTGYRPDYVLLLQPTSPLRTADDVVAAIELAQASSADSVVGVCEPQHHPFLLRVIAPDGVLQPYQASAPTDSCRQHRPPVYALNGAIFLVRRSCLLQGKTFYPPHTHAYLMPAERSLDIDTPWDLHVADLVLRAASSKAHPAAASTR